ncbi:MAG TPA: hypothetical protein VIL48_08105 [Acidimicrobiales bacterium]
MSVAVRDGTGEDRGARRGTGGAGSSDAPGASDEPVASADGSAGPAARPALRAEQAARSAAAAASLGAALIHFAYAPVHLDEALNHGAFFLAAGWLQLVLAAALALRRRPEHRWLAATALVNAAVVGVWVVSRTVGVPGSAAEDVAFPDAVATGLEVVAVAAAGALLLGRLAGRTVQPGAVRPLAGTGVVALLVLVSLAVSPSFAGGHGPGGHHGGEAGDGHAAGGHAGDHGADAAGATDAADWAETRLRALEGHLPPAEVEEFKRMAGEDLAREIRARSDALRGLDEAEREARIDRYVEFAVENTLGLLEGSQSGEAEMHSHGPSEWQPITDPEDQRRLQAQLAEAGEVIDRYPTVADAEAAGYRQISPYVPGIAAHWINGDFDGEFDPGEPEMLLFNGTEPASQLVGLSYAATGPAPPEGFVGPNDVWHSHPGLCMVGGFVVGIDGTPEELCTSIGGEINTGLADLWMAHLWQVPGWESPWGLFSGENPTINAATSDMWLNRERGR